MESKDINCNLCGQNNFAILEIDNPYQVVKCKKCGLVFVTPQPESDILASHYDKEYYDPWKKKQAIQRKKMWRRRLTKLQAFKRTGKLLDVGCECGFFLNEAKYNGWQVYGLEVSDYAVNYAKNVFGIEIFRGRLEDAHYPDNFFDVLTFWHVLEHTKDPLNNLIEARRILKPGGVIVVAVPNIHNFIYKAIYMLVKLQKPKLFSVKDREIHLYHFSAKTLKKMLEKANFIPIKFGIDKERIKLRILDTLAWVVYKILRINVGMALEVYAKKS